MSIFSETIIKAISDYRLLLRRHLNQVERMTTLQRLQLKKAETYESDLKLYAVSCAIIKDIEQNMSELTTGGYYSYSGLHEFCKYLKEYLGNYTIEHDQVVHRTQKASKALLKAIQLTAKSRDQLDDGVVKQLFECNHAIVNFGSAEQRELQMQTLMRQQTQNPGFYTRIIAHLESVMISGSSSAAA